MAAAALCGLRQGLRESERVANEFVGLWPAVLQVGVDQRLTIEPEPDPSRAEFAAVPVADLRQVPSRRRITVTRLPLAFSCNQRLLASAIFGMPFSCTTPALRIVVADRQ